MKVFTFNNKTTGRQNETINAESEQAVIKIFAEMDQQVVVTDVFDPDAMFAEAGDQKLGDLEPPLPGTEPTGSSPVKPSGEEFFFETDGIKFKMVDGTVYKKDWVEIKGKDKEDYKIVKKSKAKNGGKDQDVTKDICIFVNDWIKVKQNGKAK